MKKFYWLFLGIILLVNKTDAQTWSATAIGGSANATITGTLGTNQVTYSVPAATTTTGCYAYGFRYTNNENGFDILAGCATTATNKWQSPVLSNGNKTVTLTLSANPSTTGCVTGTATRTWTTNTLTVTITNIVTVIVTMTSPFTNHNRES